MTRRTLARIAVWAVAVLCVVGTAAVLAQPGSPLREQQPTAFQLATPTATPRPTATPVVPAGAHRSLALRGIGPDAEGNTVIRFTDGSTYTMGKSSRDSLPEESLRGLLAVAGANKGAFYACVQGRTFQLHKADVDCSTLENFDSGDLP